MRPYGKRATIPENIINAGEYNRDTEELDPHQQIQTKVFLDVGGGIGTEKRRGEKSVGPVKSLLWILYRAEKMESPDLVAVGAMTGFPGKAPGGDHPQSWEAIWYDWTEVLSGCLRVAQRCVKGFPSGAVGDGSHSPVLTALFNSLTAVIPLLQIRPARRHPLSPAALQGTKEGHWGRRYSLVRRARDGSYSSWDSWEEIYSFQSHTAWPNGQWHTWGCISTE